MSYKPLTYFTALSVAAHAAMFGLWSEPEKISPQRQESSIEVGLVVLPQIDKNFSTEKNLSQAQPRIQEQKTLQTVTNTTVIPSKPFEQSAVITNNSGQGILAREPNKEKQHVEEASQSDTNKASSAQPGNNAASAVEAAPIYAKNPAPTYPNNALRYGWEGEVWLIVHVNRSGAVNNVSIDKSSGYQELDRSAAEAVKKWQFEPARIGSETVEGTVRIPVRFKINRG